MELSMDFFMSLIFGYGGRIQDIFKWRIFSFFGRLSYSYFICHVFIMKLLILSSTQLLGVSNTKFVDLIFYDFENLMLNLNFIPQWTYTLGTYIFGNLLPIPLAILIEYPVTTLANFIFALN